MANAKRKTISISEDVLKEGEQQAQKECRSFSNYVEWLIIQDKP